MMRFAAPAVLWLVFSASAFAQDPPPKKDGEKKQGDQTVEVIGERVKDLQKEPVSGNFLDGDELERRRIGSVQDLAREVPNLGTTDSGTRSFGDVYSVRGLTNGTFFGGPSMTVYIDDVPFGDPFSYAEPLGLLESAQVFRGPQPTLFGRYGYGGVINVVSRRPTDVLQGGVYAEGGNHGLLNAGGYAMGALIPGTLRFRAGVSEQTSGGFLYSPARRDMEDTQQRIGGNFSVFYTPTKDWDIAFISDVQKYQDGGPRLNSLFAADPYTVGSDVPGRMIRMTDQEALRVGYKSGSIQFLSVTARRNFRLDPYQFDLDFTALPGNSAVIFQEQNIYSQEFRVVSAEPASDVDWVAGVYGHLKHTHQDGVHDFVVPGPAAVHEINFFSTHQRWAGLFGDLTYKGIKNWRFHLGARWDYVSEHLLRNDQMTINPFPGPLPPVAYHLSGSFPQPSVKATIDCQVAEPVLLFVDGGRAMKPGGFSAFTNEQALAPFKEEKSWFAEAGAKSTFMDGKIQANVAAFYYGIANYQLERSIANSAEYLVLNTNSARSFGFEAEVRAKAAPWLEFLGGIATARTVLGAYTDPATVGPPATPAVSHSGGTIAPFVPRYTGRIGANLNSSGFFAGAEWVATGLTHFDDLNFGFNQTNHAQLNAGFGYKAEHYQITLFGTNLNNRFYYTMMTPSISAGSPAIPRLLGVRLEVSF